MNVKINLKALMNHGHWGNSFLEGTPPIHVEWTLKQVFDNVVLERLPGAWNLYEFEWNCYDANGELRLKVQYGWTGNGWRYQPVAACRKTKRLKSGDVLYL